ncbi:hypothetical protein Q5P01_000165 [Channa striata]|uniref:Uncharacterized protein n=1 Tax=Channa striata TaxID=64152 RepID=A0AA88LED1_CHASR|nr:hypothetical protein Q5P01_000165 [Channa striata]
MDMMEFMDLVYDGEKLSGNGGTWDGSHRRAESPDPRAGRPGTTKRCGLPQYFHNFHVAGVTIGEFMTLGREENGWLLHRLVPTPGRRSAQPSLAAVSRIWEAS